MNGYKTENSCYMNMWTAVLLLIKTLLMCLDKCSNLHGHIHNRFYFLAEGELISLLYFSKE